MFGLTPLETGLFVLVAIGLFGKSVIPFLKILPLPVNILGALEKLANGKNGHTQPQLDTILAEVKLLQTNHTVHIEKGIEKLTEKFDEFQLSMATHNAQEIQILQDIKEKI